MSFFNPGKPSQIGWVRRLAILSLFFVTASVSANEPSISSTVSTDTVSVAEPFTIEITVHAPAGAKVTFPAVTDRLGDFDVRDWQDRFDVPTAEGRTWTRRMKLESITTGDLEIPPLDIQVQTRSVAEAAKPSNFTPSVQLKAQPIAIHVLSVLEGRSDPTKFRDIQSVVDLAVPVEKSSTWVWWTIGGVAGVCSFAFAGLVLSRRRQWLTPKDWAMEELDELAALIDADTVDSETIAQKLSETVRSYLLLEFGIERSGRTAQELVQEIIATQRIASQATDRLGSVFLLADKARFAGVDFSTIAMKSAVNDSRELIERIASEFKNSGSRQPSGDANENRPISGEMDYENPTEKS